MLRNRPTGSGRLVLIPGDLSGGEFATDKDTLRRCVDLFLRLNSEFDLIIVDLSAGRSYATDMVLEATAQPELRGVDARWLVFHRWTRQHVIAAAGLVFGTRGIVDGGVARGHDEDALRGTRSGSYGPRCPIPSRRCGRRRRPPSPRGCEACDAGSQAGSPPTGRSADSRGAGRRAAGARPAVA